MKYILTFFSVGLMLPLHSQPTLTSANEATIGKSFNYIYVDTAGITPGGSGVAQTWDYSGVTNLGASQIEHWIDPTSTPYASSFPGSNIVQKIDVGSGFTYQFLTLSASSTELNGIVTDIIGMTTNMNYSNSEVIRQFPVTYNSTISDTYEGIATIVISPVTATSYRSGTFEYLIDAYGTLITPLATYPHTLRVKLRQVFTDSTIYFGLPLPPVVIQYYSTTYFWASTDPGDRLYQFYIGYDTTVVVINTTSFMNVSYQDDVTGITENEIQLHSDITSFPNPANETITIRIENPVNGVAMLELYDSKGNQVQTFQGKMTKANHFEWKFSVGHLTSGLYTARISCADQYWTSKIMRQ